MLDPKRGPKLDQFMTKSLFIEKGDRPDPQIHAIWIYQGNWPDPPCYCASHLRNFVHALSRKSRGSLGEILNFQDFQEFPEPGNPRSLGFPGLPASVHTPHPRHQGIVEEIRELEKSLGCGASVIHDLRVRVSKSVPGSAFHIMASDLHGKHFDELNAYVDILKKVRA